MTGEMKEHGEAPHPDSSSAPTSLSDATSSDSTDALASAVLSSFSPSPLASLSSHLSELLQSQEALLTSLATARTSYYSSTHTQMLALLPAFAPLEEQRRRVEDGGRRLREVRKRVDSLQLRMKTLQDVVIPSKPPAAQQSIADVK